MTLHPRTTDHPSEKADAHRLLDAHKAGTNIAPDRVTWALRITGDLTDEPCSALCPQGECAGCVAPSRAHLGGAA